MLQFVYELCRKKKGAVWYISVAVAGVTVIAVLFTDLVFSHVYFQGTHPKTFPGKLYFVFVIPYSLIPTFAAFYEMIVFLKKSKNEAYNRIIKSYLIVTITIVILALGNEAFLNAYLRIKSIHLAPLFVSLQSVFIFILIKKYNFFSVTLKDVSEDIFENLPGGIIILDAQNVIKKFNKYAKDYLPLKDSDIDKTKADDFIENFKDISDFMIFSKGHYDTKHYVLYKSGLNYNNLDVGRVLYILDITELKNAEEQLVKSNEELKKLSKMKDEFVSIVSHDLRSPLGAIKIAVELIDMKENLSLEGKSMLKIILDTVDYQAKYIKSLLDIARYKRGDIELEKVNINITELVNSVADIYRLNAKDKEIEISTNCSSVIYAHVDSEKITQVLSNLLSNAVKFTPRGGKIEIVCSSEKSFLRINICDNGIGIPPADLDNLFDAFSSKTTKGTEGERGTGMGLYICKIYVRLHGGEIGAIANGNLKGTTFYFTIPL
jgi:signal transduction histidine kinase